jgi:hypothetical protein
MKKSNLLTALNGGFTNNANGALSRAGTGSPLLDFFVLSGASRDSGTDILVNSFEGAFSENPDLALKALFHARDVRGGKGERRLFRTVTSYLANKKPDVLRPLLALFADYGRWDDLLELALTPLESDAFTILLAQLEQDVQRLAAGEKNVSLVAKWLPSGNASSKKTKLLATRFRTFAKLTPKNYRKTLSQLRKVIGVVEQQMCADQWKEIKYDQVPSKAGLVYRNAFPKHDPEGYTVFKGKVKKGEAKVNTKTLFPYEVIAPIFTGQKHKIGDSYYATTRVLSEGEEDTLNMLWDNLPNFLGDEPEDGLVVVDTSGSMTGLPIKVAVSLGLYYAERNKGAFAGHFVTFSADPQLQKVEGGTLSEKVRNMVATGWNQNTNLQAVFDLILNTATKAGLKQADLPSRVYIVSDMQFDQAVSPNTFTNFEVIKRKYELAGYTAPELVFWNVNAYPGNSPVKKDERGVKLVSGASGDTFKQVLGSKAENPYDNMLETLLSDRYAPVGYFGEKE